jgi:hypothetical protein
VLNMLESIAPRGMAKGRDERRSGPA